MSVSIDLNLQFFVHFPPLTVPLLLDVVRSLAYYLPWTETLTSFAKDEDPVKYVMDEVASIFPVINQVGYILKVFV